MEFDARASPAGEVGREALRQFDGRAVNPLTLTPGDLRPNAEFWLLEQAGGPVGAIEPTALGWSLRGRSERWHAAVTRRPRRLGWHLAFARQGEREPALRYFPSTLMHGGVLVLSDGRRFKLRRPLVRSDWRLAAVSMGELARIRYLGRTSRNDNRQHVDLTPIAATEPQLLFLMLATCTAILVHDLQPRTSASTTA